MSSANRRLPSPGSRSTPLLAHRRPSVGNVRLRRVQLPSQAVGHPFTERLTHARQRRNEINSYNGIVVIDQRRWCRFMLVVYGWLTSAVMISQMFVCLVDAADEWLAVQVCGITCIMIRCVNAKLLYIKTKSYFSHTSVCSCEQDADVSAVAIFGRWKLMTIKVGTEFEVKTPGMNVLP